MKYFEKEINKKYFNIGEVAENLNVNTSLIRFWEEKFDILNPKKNNKGPISNIDLYPSFLLTSSNLNLLG